MSPTLWLCVLQLASVLQLAIEAKAQIVWLGRVHQRSGSSWVHSPLRLGTIALFSKVPLASLLAIKLLVVTWWFVPSITCLMSSLVIANIPMILAFLYQAGLTSAWNIAYLLRAGCRMRVSERVKTLHREMAVSFPTFCPLGTREGDQFPSSQGGRETKAASAFPRTSVTDTLESNQYLFSFI